MKKDIKIVNDLTLYHINPNLTILNFSKLKRASKSLENQGTEALKSLGTREIKDLNSATNQGIEII